ncbi:D-glycerate 3-kinase, plant type [hydrothermal vent metagenome]|uniref:D-glycerate 3-kinase, plant type n=1 Tax=hydrothermal vent metagenome TaxID=652676 RepID=A0A3B1D7A7_9ZZZZ
MISETLKRFIRREQLPKNYEKTILTWFFPLAETLKKICLVHKKPLVVGIQGAQGSGKSTLAALLVHILKEQHELRSINISLDDFYLTQKERLHLSSTVHPLLKTRGVPGTHDLGLASRTLDALSVSGLGESVPLPRFDKALDDRLPSRQWSQANPPLDLIFLEGWCLAAPAENDESLIQPINMLEEKEDQGGHWRRYVNGLLETDYADFFHRLNLLIVLQLSSFEQVYEWRFLQERKRAEKRICKTPHFMQEADLKRFIQHFERVTRNCLSLMPQKADILFRLNDAHEIVKRFDSSAFDEA